MRRAQAFFRSSVLTRFRQGRSATVSTAGLIWIVLLWLAPGPCSVADEPTDPDPSPVLTVEQRLQDGPHPGPRLSLWADGRLQVHRPPYMKHAGDSLAMLPGDEVVALLARLDALDLSDLVASGRQQAEEARITSPGAAQTTIRRRSAENASTMRWTLPLQTFKWRFLRRGADHEARRLADLDGLVMSLFNHPELRALEAPEVTQ